MQRNSYRVSDLIGGLEPDPWRVEVGFSDDIERCHAVLFDPRRTRREKQAALYEWLAGSQPCLFGRMEAKQSRLDLCLLTENDLERSDAEIRGLIEIARSAWKSRARVGGTHGFLIVAVSQRIAYARQGLVLRQLAERVCELYLGECSADIPLLDDLILELDLEGRRCWRKWKVGVNYFSCQAHDRWWHDHPRRNGILDELGRPYGPHDRRASTKEEPGDGSGERAS